MVVDLLALEIPALAASFADLFPQRPRYLPGRDEQCDPLVIRQMRQLGAVLGKRHQDIQTTLDIFTGKCRVSDPVHFGHNINNVGEY
jgi:hypothetical protein